MTNIDRGHKTVCVCNVAMNNCVRVDDKQRTINHVEGMFCLAIFRCEVPLIMSLQSSDVKYVINVYRSCCTKYRLTICMVIIIYVETL